MKAVLISVRPKWCELIASGKKTVEVRKSRPKLETPFKVYIYCTKGRFEPSECLRNNLHYDDSTIMVCEGQGKVIGEFVCDEINAYTKAFFDEQEERDTYDIARFIYHSRIKYDDLCAYVGLKDFYAWHISNLVIYDKPKDLQELRRYPRTEHCGFGECELCRHGDYDQLEDKWFCRNYIARAPQSWCYVEDD